MKNIGSIIKEARMKKKLSLSRLEKEIKVKKNFLQAIEKNDWANLPDFPVLTGFVKNICRVLSLDEEKILAILRRDYPPKALAINPKPDISNKFVWSPKLTFLVGVMVVAMLVLGYLAFQYYHFMSPPTLTISEPKENQIVSQTDLVVSGRTDTDATVSINNQPTIIDADGKFTTTIEINDKTTEIDIKAISRSRKETVVKVKIRPELNNG